MTVDKSTGFNLERKYASQKEVDKRLEEWLQQFRPKIIHTYIENDKTVTVYEPRNAMGLAYNRNIVRV
jgi:hypothetical protein